MIYVDTSAVLARVLAEQRVPPAHLWRQRLVASRLLEFEVWNRIHARGLGRSHAAHVRWLLSRVEFSEMTHGTLVRALSPFPVPVRTLDALHLATADHLRSQGRDIEIAAYDERLRTAAAAMGFDLYPL